MQTVNSEEEAIERNRKKTPGEPSKYMKFSEYVSEVFRLLNYKLGVMNLTPEEREMLVLEKLIFAEYNPSPVKMITRGTQTLRVEFKEKEQDTTTHDGRLKLEAAHQVAEYEIKGIRSQFNKNASGSGQNKKIIKLV